MLLRRLEKDPIGWYSIETLSKLLKHYEHLEFFGQDNAFPVHLNPGQDKLSRILMRSAVLMVIALIQQRLIWWHFFICKKCVNVPKYFLPQDHNDVMTWKLFLDHWPFVRGIQKSLVNSFHNELVLRSFDVCFVVSPNKLLEQTVVLPVIDTPWCMCEVTVTFLFVYIYSVFL